MSRSVIIVVLVASIAVVLASAIEEATIGSQTTQQQNDSSRLRIVTTPQRTTSKYCADLSPLREFLATSIEPYYAPLIGLLPDNIQIVLLDNTSFGGFSNASCLLASFLLFVVLLSWFAAAKSLQTSAQNTNARLNEFIVSLKLALNQANLKSNAFEHEIGELQNRLKESERKLSKAEEDRNEASEHRAKELEERLKQNESRVSKEVNTLKLELAESVEREERQKTDYEAQISELVERLGKLNEELEKSDSSIREMKEREVKLTAELESVSASVTNHKESSDDTNSKRNVSINDQSNNSAVVRVIELEEKMSELEKEVKAKSSECLSLSEMVKSNEEKQRDLERQLKESELQIKILNDLREKDTKQHIKSMADLDNQLKKKCTESEKITLMLDQVRAKSERIHELEAQFARIERQSTNERQTYEKQAHENWLQARKNERELKDARQELVTVKERLADAEASVKALQSENQLLKQQQQQNLYKFPAGYYMNSPNLNRSIESPSGSAPLTTQLEIDTAGGENPSSSGATNNNNAHNNHNNHHNHDSRGSSSASSSSGGPVSNSNHKKQHPHPVSGSNSQHSVHHQPSPKFMTPPPSMMAYPSPNGLNGSSGGPTPPPIPQPPLIPYEYPQHVMMKMMHQQQQYMQNYKYMAAAAAAYANAVAASSSNASIGRASPSASSQASPRQHHNSLTMNHSATYPNGNSTSFLNESSSVGNLNSPRETSLEKDDSSLKPNEENSPIQNSTKNDLNDHLTSTTTKKDDLVPTNLASNFEV